MTDDLMELIERELSKAYDAGFKEGRRENSCDIVISNSQFENIDDYLLQLRERLLAFMEDKKTTTVPLSGKMGLNHLTLRGFVKANKAPTIATIRIIEEYLDERED